jgi:hypothetical protein
MIRNLLFLFKENFIGELYKVVIPFLIITTNIVFDKGMETVFRAFRL